MASRAAVEAETATTSTTELVATGLLPLLYSCIFFLPIIRFFRFFGYTCFSFILITLFIDIHWPELGCCNWEKQKGPSRGGVTVSIFCLFHGPRKEILGNWE